MAISEATEPKSECYCGHTGDGPSSQHAGPIGHGFCTVKGCTCQKFTWKRWLPYGKDLMAKLRKRSK